MLFNSYLFIFIFLPITLAGFYLIGERGHHRIANTWLVGASFFFYGWWNPPYLLLMLGSILFNYSLGVALGNQNAKQRKFLLIVGVSANLCLIGYFKYAHFFIENLTRISGIDYNLGAIILPLGISFYTFQKIAYLVDTYQGKTKEYNFLHYCLFVTFFPQLVAGPIVHHKEVMPQFAKNSIYRLNYENIAVGITIFTIGLFKKVCLADNVAPYSTAVFEASNSGISLTFFEAWAGALAYSFQIYFDFSGYSDMAIGIARMFGILLPLNFASPYQAKNIIEFWRCWHITLSRFLKDYLYIPLGGNRKGKTMRYVNLIVTMFIGGLWHGAAWTFILWGSLHGCYLAINHAWHAFRRFLGHDLKSSSFLGYWTSRLITFCAIVFAWVIFRAESLDSAKNVLSAMIGANGISLPIGLGAKLNSNLFLLANQYGIVFDGIANNLLCDWKSGIKIILFLWAIAFFFPNTQQFMRNYKPSFEESIMITQSKYAQRLLWKPSKRYAILTAIMLFLSMSYLNKVSEFLYFNF